MNIEMLLEGQSVVKLSVDLPAVVHLLQKAIGNGVDARSTPATDSQIRDLLTRIDQRSGQFLREIAASDNGSITWKRMRQIFGIEKDDDWAAYSGSFGKGITRAYRNILDNKVAKLVWWIDSDWEDADWDDDTCAVYVDGPALAALRSVVSQ